MPRTRLRTSYQVSAKATGGSGSGSSSNPAGSSLTTEGVGFFDIAQAEAAVATPADAALYDLLTSSAESSTAPTDAQAFDIATATDTAAAPTAGHTTALLVGATTVAQTVGGTTWTNPANAQGVNDGTLAVLTNTSTTAKTGTLVGTFTTAGTAATETQTGTVALTFYRSVVIGTLASASLQLAYSTDGGTNYTVTETLTAANAGPAGTPVTLTGFTLTNLPNLRFRAVGSATGSAVGAAATLNLDAVVASFTTTGGAG